MQDVLITKMKSFQNLQNLQNLLLENQNLDPNHSQQHLHHRLPGPHQRLPRSHPPLPRRRRPYRRSHHDVSAFATAYPSMHSKSRPR